MTNTMPQEPPQQQRPVNLGKVIAVASGKGGVGKSTVAVNLACALAALGHRTALLDADIYGPSQHIMLGLREEQPRIGDDQKIHPILTCGISVMSFGFFVKPEDAVIWRGPMISRMFQQFVNDVAWGSPDYTVIDLPPGTGDIQLTLTQVLPVTGIVIVTTPQDVALADAVKGINMFRKVDVEILGVIENMSTFICPHCQHETQIFSHAGAKKRAESMEAPFLGELPLEETTRVSGDEGIPIVVKEPKSPQGKRFLDIARTVIKAAEEISKRPKPAEPSGASVSHFEV